jgi:hypothetical protein
MPEVGNAIVRQYTVTVTYVVPGKCATLIRFVCNLRGWWHIKTGIYHDEIMRRILGGQE